MCGRYSLEFDEGFYTRFKLSKKIPVETNYNVSPGQMLPTVVSHSPNTLEYMMWGLIPFWEEQNERPKTLINVRQDTIQSKAWTHRYIKHNRCLVPATGFYEWKRDTLGKHPYYFYLKDKTYYAFAGIYSETKHVQTKKTIKSFSLITTQANKLMSSIHDRLPVILNEKDEDVWLNHDETDIAKLTSLLVPYNDQEMGMYPVTPKINSFSFTQKPHKIEPVEQNNCC